MIGPENNEKDAKNSDRTKYDNLAMLGRSPEQKEHVNPFEKAPVARPTRNTVIHN